MKVFVIHRFNEQKAAKKAVRELISKSSIKISSVFLDSSIGESWKMKALEYIDESEMVVIYNRELCLQSKNCKWEIDQVTSLKKPIIELKDKVVSEENLKVLRNQYNYTNEFEDCFSDEKDDLIDLYKVMLNTSESLIQRRQSTNAFFITVIGSLLGVAGLLVNLGVLKNGSSWVLYVISITGLLLCNSWRNLIDNYGKLNTAKFSVLLKIENMLDAKIFAAEWIALGKGNRPQKYKSFTSTEKNVPLYFGFLILLLTIIAIINQVAT